MTGLFLPIRNEQNPTKGLNVTVAQSSFLQDYHNRCALTQTMLKINIVAVISFLGCSPAIQQSHHPKTQRLTAKSYGWSKRSITGQIFDDLTVQHKQHEAHHLNEKML